MPITEDGDTILDVVEGREYLVLLNGDFGGGTLTLSYFEDSTSEYIPITDASWTDESENTIPICPSRKLKATLSGATDPEINLRLVEGAKL